MKQFRVPEKQTLIYDCEMMAMAMAMAMAMVPATVLLFGNASLLPATRRYRRQYCTSYDVQRTYSTVQQQTIAGICRGKEGVCSP
jgi:hypothetical protein